MNFILTNILNPIDYAFNPFAVLPFFAGIIIATLTFLILKRENFSQASLMFAFLASSVLLWLWAYVGIFSSTNESVALWWSRLQNIGVCFIPTATFFFVISITEKLKYYKYYAATGIMISFIFMLLVTRTNTFVTGVFKYPWGFYAKYMSAASVLFILYFLNVMSFVIYLFWKEHKNAITTKQKNRYRLFIIATLIANTGGVDYLPAFGISIFPFGFLSVFIFMLVLFLLVTKYELMDISPAFAAQQIIQNMNDILIIFSKDGIIQFTNPAASDFFGINPEDLIAKHILQIIKNPDFSKNYNKILKLGFVNDYELKYKRILQDVRILNLSILAIRNPLRQTLAVVLIGKDRTEYKKAEEQLQKAYAVPKTIIEGVPVGIIVSDQKHRVQHINKTALGLLGIDAEKDILHKPYKIKTIDNKKSGEDQEKITKEKDTFEEIIQTPQGDNLTIIKSTLPLTIDNENLNLDIFIDITDRKELEQKLQEYKTYLEKLVQERTKELGAAHHQLVQEVSNRKTIEDDLRNYIFDLEKFKKITIDRENKMKELQREANQLAKELNEPEPYTLN